MSETIVQMQLPFLKALADENRLKILALLVNQPLTVEQLAEILGLRPSTVSHHLSQLAGVGLVRAQSESYYNVYHLESQTFEAMAEQLLARETFLALASSMDVNAYDRKVIADYTSPDGRLKVIPTQRKKLEAVLKHIAEAFEPGMDYSGEQVNAVLARFHDDIATLRRGLVDYHLMERERTGNAYWRLTAGVANGEHSTESRGKHKKDRKSKKKGK